MINAEKYKDEINEEYLNLLKRNVIDGDGNRMNKAIKTIAYKHCGKQLCGASSTFKWLCEEYKEPIKVSKLEYDILKYLFNDTGYRYIVRDKYYHEGDIFYLYIFKNRPREDSGGWHSNDPYDRSQFYAFNNLFKFIKFEDEKPTLIQSILENCEVVDGESE